MSYLDTDATLVKYRRSRNETPRHTDSEIQTEFGWWCNERARKNGRGPGRQPEERGGERAVKEPDIDENRPTGQVYRKWIRVATRMHCLTDPSVYFMDDRGLKGIGSV